VLSISDLPGSQRTVLQPNRSIGRISLDIEEDKQYLSVVKTCQIRLARWVVEPLRIDIAEPNGCLER